MRMNLACQPGNVLTQIRAVRADPRHPGKLPGGVARENTNPASNSTARASQVKDLGIVMLSIYYCFDKSAQMTGKSPSTQVLKDEP